MLTLYTTLSTLTFTNTPYRSGPTPPPGVVPDHRAKSQSGWASGGPDHWDHWDNDLEGDQKEKRHPHIRHHSELPHPLYGLPEPPAPHYTAGAVIMLHEHIKAKATQGAQSMHGRAKVPKF